MNLVLIGKAIEILGVTDPESFKRDAKRLGCLFKHAGIIKIDVEKFESAIDAKFAKAAETASAGKVKKRNVGSDLGIISARIAQYDARHAAKIEKITSMKQAIAKAISNYERVKLQRDLKKAEAERERLEEGNQRDIMRRDEILNMTDEASSAE